MYIEKVKKIAQAEMNKAITKNLDSAIIFKYISNLEKELEKKEAIINEMAKWLVGYTYSDEENLEAIFNNKEEVIDYFTNKVEKEGIKE